MKVSNSWLNPLLFLSAAIKLRLVTGWPSSNQNTDENGFNLLPAGHFYSDESNNIFRNIGSDEKLWTASTEPGSNYYAIIII